MGQRRIAADDGVNSSWQSLRELTEFTGLNERLLELTEFTGLREKLPELTEFTGIYRC